MLSKARSVSGVTKVDIAYRGGNWCFHPIFPLKNWRPFLVIALWKVMTFLAVVSSPLPSSHVVYPVFFLNSAKKLILAGCYPLEGVTRGAVPPSPTP